MFSGKRNSLCKVLYKNQNNSIPNTSLSNFTSTGLSTLSTYNNSDSFALKGKKEIKLHTSMSPNVLPVCNCNNDVNQINSLLIPTSSRLHTELAKTRANTICTEPDKKFLFNCNQNLPLTVDVNCLFFNNDSSLITASSDCLSAQHIGSNFNLQKNSCLFLF